MQENKANIDIDWLENNIKLFISAIEECRDSTVFEEDRELFARDVELALGWLSHLKQHKASQEIIDMVLSPYTAKHLGDYWKRDPWGNLEMKALQALRMKIKSRSEGEIDV